MGSRALRQIWHYLQRRSQLERDIKVDKDSISHDHSLPHRCLVPKLSGGSRCLFEGNHSKSGTFLTGGWVKGMMALGVIYLGCHPKVGA